MNFSRMIATLLALLGLLDASYLALERLRGGELFCPLGGGCATVQNSPYAVVFGVPIAYVGVAAYAVLFVLLLLSLQREALFSLPAVLPSFGVACVGVVFSAYLTYLQLFVINAICFWCITSAIIQAVIWLLLLREIAHHRAEVAPVFNPKSAIQNPKSD